jgi:hypothetical protein
LGQKQRAGAFYPPTALKNKKGPRAFSGVPRSFAACYVDIVSAAANRKGTSPWATTRAKPQTRSLSYGQQTWEVLQKVDIDSFIIK